jgi:hypothetical protein
MGIENTGGEPAWDGVLRREIDVEFRVLDDATRTFEVVASTEALDSHGDVVKAFWDLSRFEKNGAILWNHNLALYTGCSAEDTLLIGTGVAKLVGKKLMATIRLVVGTATEEPLIDKIWRRVQQGIQKAVSVGFRPGQVTRIVNAAGDTDYYELGSKDRPNELREISLVPMGSNPEAVAKSIAFERRHLEALVINTDSGRPAASKTAESGKDTKPMDEELKKALEARALAEKALADEKAAREKADKETGEQRARAEKAERDLAAEKTVNSKLATDLEVANKGLADANAEVAKAALDALQGVKFAPAEREELDALVTSVGLKRVKSLLEKRSDLTLTQPVTDGQGKPLNKGEPPPAPAPSADPSAELVSLANKAIN